MSEISETEIKSMTKEQNYMRGYKDGKSDALDKIRFEIIEKYWDCDICKHNGHFNIRGDIYDILQIIDKYKAESEDKE